MNVLDQAMHDRLSALHQDFSNLANQMAEAARRLREEEKLPDDSLLEQLQTSKRNLMALREDIERAAQIAGMPNSSSFPAAPLSELEARLRVIAAYQNRHVLVHDRAVEILERVLALRHRQQGDYPR